MFAVTKEYSDLRCLSSLVRRHFRTLIPFLTVRKTYNILICLARIIHVFADTKSLLCYKHAVNTIFEALPEAFA